MARKHLFLIDLASVPKNFLSTAINKAVLKHHVRGLHELTENLNFDECEILTLRLLMSYIYIYIYI